MFVLVYYFKVVVLDLCGYNDLDKLDNGYDLDILAVDIWGLIECLGYLKVYIVGYDWGGAIVWYLV